MERERGREEEGQRKREKSLGWLLSMAQSWYSEQGRHVLHVSRCKLLVGNGWTLHESEMRVQLDK